LIESWLISEAIHYLNPKNEDKFMKAIIVGCGRQGALLAKLLEKENVNVTIIDNNPRSFARLGEFKGKKVLGDGMKEQVLKRAGIESADAFAAVTNTDNINLISAQVARGIYRVPRVVCRVYDPHRAVVYADLGLDTVNYSETGTQLLKSYITNPEVLRKLPIGDGSASTIEFRISSKYIGKPFSNLNIPGIFQGSALIRGMKVIVASPDFEIQEGDKVFGVAIVSKLNDVFQEFGVQTEDEKE
jgi:trk system potassium uptake protein TrkA